MHPRYSTKLKIVHNFKQTFQYKYLVIDNRTAYSPHPQRVVITRVKTEAKISMTSHYQDRRKKGKAEKRHIIIETKTPRKFHTAAHFTHYLAQGIPNSGP